jgi:hypothetical protein
MFLWDAPLDVPGAPRDAEPREAAAWAAPRVSVVEFAPVDGAAQLALGEAVAQLREAVALGEAAAQLREEPAEVDEPAGPPRELAEPDEPAGPREPAEPDERAGIREPAEPDERARIRARVRPPELAQAREPARVRGVDLRARVGQRFDSALQSCDSGQVLAQDAACPGAAADSHALR